MAESQSFDFQTNSGCRRSAYKAKSVLTVKHAQILSAVVKVKAMPRRFYTLVLGLICIFWSGCGADNSAPNSFNDEVSCDSTVDSRKRSEESSQIHLTSQAPDLSSDNETRAQTNVIPAGTTAESSGHPDSIRKIIDTANLNLTVESFTGVADSIIRLSRKFDGFVAQAHISGTTGNQRPGSWTPKNSIGPVPSLPELRWESRGGYFSE